ncbi:ABC transporter permease [Actinospica durhamensis]|uniref:ABC transporter permease n=1 Tax=Actinospica durhamensis TaxID=1508375 RepID=A0A941IT65_9ACTN|nr:ABC transporter permease [Actinospica durhamensis]MBR7834026.1 ABC transporter permease [Actinospica durhamensis]
MAATESVTINTLPGNGAGSGHAHFGRLLVAEWTKLRSVRSTYWSLITVVLAFPFFSWLIPFLIAHNWNQADPGSRAQVLQDPVSTIIGVGIDLGQFGIAVLGVLVMASEYSTGMIRSTVLASPRRVRMLAAKSVVFTLLALVIGEIVSFVAFFIGQLTFKSVLTVNLGAGTNLREVVGAGLYLGMLALFSMVIGALIRHPAGAITGVVLLLLVISNIIQLIPGAAGKYLYSYEPTNAGAAILTNHTSDKFLLTAWEGYAVFAGWTALLWVLAAWLLVRRDA